MNLAIIPARIGSKRIPKKNIKSFLGKPIISYSILSALESGIFDEVMVSTDDLVVADIAKENGASVPFMRSRENSNDTATTSDVILEILNTYGSSGRFFSNVFCIYATAPFITCTLLRNAYDALVSNPEVNTVIPVVRYSYPPQRGIYINDGIAEMCHPEYMNTRSQDLQAIYHDSGQFYAFKTDCFMKSHNLWSGKIKTIILPETMVQDIDTPEDWALAELKYTLTMNNRRDGI